jgi:hypothetical protein
MTCCCVNYVSLNGRWFQFGIQRVGISCCYRKIVFEEKHLRHVRRHHGMLSSSLCFLHKMRSSCRAKSVWLPQSDNFDLSGAKTNMLSFCHCQLSARHTMKIMFGIFYDLY